MVYPPLLKFHNQLSEGIYGGLSYGDLAIVRLENHTRNSLKDVENEHMNDMNE
jgi:hypothetical protein